MVVAFDYDGILSLSKVQKLVKKMIREGMEVWIVTARRDNDFNQNKLKPVLEKLGLTEHRVIYVDEKPKIEYLKLINADLYIDNDSSEFYEINNFTNTIPVLYHE